MENQNKVKIRKFLMQYIQDPNLEDEDDIFTSGYINSLFAMQLILFVEKTFKIKIENEDLQIDNFRTINALARLITEKRLVKK